MYWPFFSNRKGTWASASCRAAPAPPVHTPSTSHAQVPYLTVQHELQHQTPQVHKSRGVALLSPLLQLPVVAGQERRPPAYSWPGAPGHDWWVPWGPSATTQGPHTDGPLSWENKGALQQETKAQHGCCNSDFHSLTSPNMWFLPPNPACLGAISGFSLLGWHCPIESVSHICNLHFPSDYLFKK